MRHPYAENREAPSFSRRRFVQGLAFGGGLAALGMMPRSGLASSAGKAGGAPQLHGNTFDLVIDELPVNFTGKAGTAMAINGSVPGPTLHWRQGELVTIRVANRLRVPTSLHWHGILLPFQMDGVPGLSFGGIAPGETFVYRFRVTQAGTYWYHSHSGFQEQNALYGAVVIHPAAGERVAAERDYVVMLNDWSDADPEFIFRRLKTAGGYDNYARPSMADPIRQAEQEGVGRALDRRLMWDRMRMSPRDLPDVSGATYTYLMNGNTPRGDWRALFKRGERVRLRFINGSSMTYFDVRIPGLKMTVVAADGQDIHPVSVDEFRIGTAETLDVVVTPSGEQAYCLFAQSMDRAGYARGTLTPHEAQDAPIPPLDPVPTLSMADMAMKMEMLSMNKASGMKGRPGMNGASGRSMEDGGHTGMRARQVSMRLDDPGAGLRGNGRKVLTLAEMHSIEGPVSSREPERGIEMHLTGNMERYVWGFNGVSYEDAEPVHLKHGETVRILLVNDTMMSHPIHLHGLWSEVENEQGAFQVRKHTLSVPPGRAITYRVHADAIGRWAYHCHLLYHMNAGMFREVRVS